MVENRGVSFGIAVPYLSVISVGLLIILLLWLWKEKRWPLVLIIVGGGLNTLQRITEGKVLDYWKIPGLNLYNNINDWLIFVGVLWLFLDLWKQKKSR